MALLAVLPWILSAVGSILPSVISSLAGAKSPSEAKTAMAPHRSALITQAIGRGMRRDEAEAQVDQELSGALEEEMSKGAIPGWAELGLGVAGAALPFGVGKIGKAVKGASPIASKAPSKVPLLTSKTKEVTGELQRRRSNPAKLSGKSLDTVDAEFEVVAPMEAPFKRLTYEDDLQQGY